ncbi:MAG: transglutaminase domain-containing protein, partial [Candidatus Omnitrophica bacterium]|nr:transglutaminase domain-containing protein [Candidatus Omnitrophota bacterium]
LISAGRDIELVPKQSGSPVNIFFYPYVEVDGKEWDDAKTSFEFKNKT